MCECGIDITGHCVAVSLLRSQLSAYLNQSDDPNIKLTKDGANLIIHEIERMRTGCSSQFELRAAISEAREKVKKHFK